jgi:DNA-binding transcriptional LysR family regulator
MIGLAKTAFGIALLPLAAVEPALARNELQLLDVHPPPPSLPIVGSMRADSPSRAAEAMIRLAVDICTEFIAERQASATLENLFVADRG